MISTEDSMTTPIISKTMVRPAPHHWRIKLYELEEQGAWIDKGTGFVNSKVVAELGGPALVIRSEENDGVIFFQSKIQVDDVYEVQGGELLDVVVVLCWDIELWSNSQFFFAK
jgi:hypothetical protein